MNGMERMSNSMPRVHSPGAEIFLGYLNVERTHSTCTISKQTSHRHPQSIRDSHVRRYTDNLPTVLLLDNLLIKTSYDIRTKGGFLLPTITVVSLLIIF